MPKFRVTYREKPVEYSMDIEAANFTAVYDTAKESLDKSGGKSYEILKIELETV